MPSLDRTKFIRFEKTKDGLFQKLCGLYRNEIDIYISEIKSRVKFERLTENQIIEQAIPENKKQLLDALHGVSEPCKKLRRRYLMANAVCFNKMFRHVFDDIFFEKLQSCNDSLLINNYCYILSRMLRDAAFLIECYDVMDDNQTQTYVRNPSKHSYSMYQFLRQSIFGQASFNSKPGIELDMSVSVIRQMIEVRLRRGIGILGALNKETKSFEPIPMKIIFDSVRDINSSSDVVVINNEIPFRNVKRIYSWANIFMHEGEMPFAWQPIMVMKYLHVMMTGKKASECIDGIMHAVTNMDNGIEIKLADLYKIRNTVKHKFDSDFKKKFKLVKLDIPKAKII